MFVLNVMALFSVSFGVSVTISFISVVISVYECCHHLVSDVGLTTMLCTWPAVCLSLLFRITMF